MRVAVVFAAAALSCHHEPPVRPIVPPSDPPAVSSSSDDAGAANVMVRRVIVRSGSAAPEHMLAVQAVYPDLAACQPPPAAVLTFVFAIDANGKVTDIKRVGGVSAPAFESCVFDTIKSIAFVPGPVTLEYTLSF